jgi:hypothetical protein
MNLVTLVVVVELVMLVALVALPISAPVNEGATIPAVEVTIPVDGTIVRPVARVFKTLAEVPLAVDVNSRRALTLVAVFAIEIVLPEPAAPLTSPKSSIAALTDPTFVTVGVDPGARAVTVPTETLAAEPCVPVCP